MGVDRDGLGAVVRLVDADETVGELEHVVTQRDDDKLRVLRPFLQCTTQHTQITIVIVHIELRGRTFLIIYGNIHRLIGKRVMDAGTFFPETFTCLN